MLMAVGASLGKINCVPVEQTLGREHLPFKLQTATYRFLARTAVPGLAKWTAFHSSTYYQD